MNINSNIKKLNGIVYIRIIVFTMTLLIICFSSILIKPIQNRLLGVSPFSVATRLVNNCFITLLKFTPI